MVAGELERRWEEKLRALRTVEDDYARFQHRPPTPLLTPEQRHQFQHLSETLPTLWQSGSLSLAHQKELLRCLISQVILKRLAPQTIEVRIVWLSGHYSIVPVRVPVLRMQDLENRAHLIQRIHALWQQGVNNDAAMATQLTTEGFASARREEVCAKTVQKIRLAHGWHYGVYQRRQASYGEGYLTVDHYAAKIGVERTWILKRIYTGAIGAHEVKRLPHSRVWLIKEDPAIVTRLQHAIAAHRHL